jgi:DNA replication protein DnaC
MTTTSAKATKPVAPLSVPELAADLDAGLRRLKLAAIRRTAPEVLQTAKTQRWTPEEVLRTLVETELAARDASNVVNRLKAAGFPVAKTLESFDVAASSIQPKTFDYLSSLEWVRAQSNLAIIGPAGTGKSHTLIGLGIAAIHAGRKARYFTAADLVETLYRGLADNTVGKIIESLLRVDLIILDELGFAPLDDTPQRSCCSGSSLAPTNADPWPSARTGPFKSGADSCQSRPPPSASSTASRTTPPSSSPTASPTE